MDTVSLEGKPFETLVSQGDKIKADQPLLKADLDQIRAAGLSIETPVVITNQKPFAIVQTGEVKAGDDVMKME